MEHVVGCLADRGFALAGVSFGEDERHLGLAHLGRTNEHLQQDLEAVRPEPLQIDAPEIDHEEAAHRVGDAAKRSAEANSRKSGRAVREERAQGAEVVGVATVGVPAGDDEIDVATLGALGEARDQLWRMLQVRVHHANPAATCARHAGDDGSRQPSRALLRRTVDQLNGQVESLRRFEDRGGSRVVAVVDEDDFDVGLCRDRREPCQKRGDIRRLFLRWNDHADQEVGRVRRTGSVPVQVTVLSAEHDRPGRVPVFLGHQRSPLVLVAPTT